MCTANLRTVLLAALVTGTLFTACQKEESASFNGTNEQPLITAIKGAEFSDGAMMRKVPTLIVTEESVVARKRKNSTTTPPPPPPDNTTTTTTEPPPSDTVITVPPPPTTIPSGYSLVMPPVGYQGSEGSCVAWAVAYAARSCMEYYKTNAVAYSDANNIFSPEYVFNQVKATTNCSGSAMLKSISLLATQGVCSWQSMPYSYMNGCSVMPGASQTTEAASYKIASYVRVLPSDQVTIKTMIASNKPVPFTFNTDYQFDRATTGFIWKTYAGFSGSHAMVLCGYDDAKHAYKAMNCWGTSWGDAGYIWIDYDLLPVISFEAYVMNL
jgi:hypothetical protein